jgi:hypothetical protein
MYRILYFYRIVSNEVGAEHASQKSLVENVGDSRSSLVINIHLI